ncbi:uncharacterized protein [Euphorbia lathyris]|uniref:uncharacterized protein n=1 Tax=Euphorbia lathyris TaxID=212925 RepID=UPI003313B7B7
MFDGAGQLGVPLPACLPETVEGFIELAYLPRSFRGYSWWHCHIDIFAQLPMCEGCSEVHSLLLGVALGNQPGFEPGNASIGFVFDFVDPSAAYGSFALWLPMAGKIN